VLNSSLRRSLRNRRDSKPDYFTVSRLFNTFVAGFLRTPLSKSTAQAVLIEKYTCKAQQSKAKYMIIRAGRRTLAGQAAPIVRPSENV
jgi:hypothetical protein